MARKYKAGDKFVLISTPHGYVDVSTHTEYTLYETIDGRLVFRDDVNDERAFTDRSGILSDWMQPCDIRLVNDVEKPVMIDAEELLKYISKTSAIYGMNVAQVQEYLKGYIKGRKEENK